MKELINLVLQILSSIWKVVGNKMLMRIGIVVLEEQVKRTAFKTDDALVEVYKAYTADNRDPVRVHAAVAQLIEAVSLDTSNETEAKK